MTCEYKIVNINKNVFIMPIKTTLQKNKYDLMCVFYYLLKNVVIISVYPNPVSDTILGRDVKI